MGTLAGYGLLRVLRPKTKQANLDQEVKLQNESSNEYELCVQCSRLRVGTYTRLTALR